MIRPARLSDIEALLGMGKRFGIAAELPVPICPASLGATFCQLIENGVLLTNDEQTCAAGALVFPAYYNTSYMLSQEVFWWVEPDARGSIGMRLLSALEGACEAKGAKSLIMVTLEAIKPEATGRVYRRCGYAPLEHGYVKHF